MLFVGLMTIYVAVLRGSIEVYDTQAMLAVTQNLVDHGTLKTTGAGYSLATEWAPYGIGISLLAVPVYVLSKWIGHYAALVSLVAPVLTALCSVLMYRIARVLDWRASHALFSAVGFGGLSMALWYTTELLSEPAVTLCMLVIILGLIRWRQGSGTAPLWIGLAAGCAVQLRSDSLFVVWVGLLAIPLFVPWRVIRSGRSMAYLLVPMAASVVAMCWYNDLRYNQLFVGSYGPGGGFSTPLFHGLRGLLLSPGRSLFLFNPLVVLGVVGLVVLYGGPVAVRDRPLAVLFVLFVVPRLVFYAKWGVWDAGSVWGPRFLLPSMAVLTLSLVPVLRATARRRVWGQLVRSAAVLLGVLAVVINYVSVRVPLGQWLTMLGTPEGRATMGIDGLQTAAQQADAIDFQWATAPIWGCVTLLRRHMADASGRWWRSGDGPIGYLLLSVGIGCLLVAAAGTSEHWLQARLRPTMEPSAAVE